MLGGLKLGLCQNILKRLKRIFRKQVLETIGISHLCQTRQ